jgi:hypothetical protein
MGQRKTGSVNDIGIWVHACCRRRFEEDFPGGRPEEGAYRRTAPCYTFFLVSHGKEPKVQNGVKEESSETGKIVKPGDEACK